MCHCFCYVTVIFTTTCHGDRYHLTITEGIQAQEMVVNLTILFQQCLILCELCNIYAHVHLIFPLFSLKRNNEWLFGIVTQVG